MSIILLLKIKDETNKLLGKCIYYFKIENWRQNYNKTGLCSSRHILFFSITVALINAVLFSPKIDKGKWLEGIGDDSHTPTDSKSSHLNSPVLNTGNRTELNHFSRFAMGRVKYAMDQILPSKAWSLFEAAV